MSYRFDFVKPINIHIYHRNILLRHTPKKVGIIGIRICQMNWNVQKTTGFVSVNKKDL